MNINEGHEVVITQQTIDIRNSILFNDCKLYLQTQNLVQLDFGPKLIQIEDGAHTPCNSNFIH